VLPNRSTEENDQYNMLFFSIHPIRSYIVLQRIVAWKILLITKVWTVKIIIENAVQRLGLGCCVYFVFDRPAETPSESIRNFRRHEVKISTNTKCRHARKGLLFVVNENVSPSIEQTSRDFFTIDKELNKIFPTQYVR